MRSFWSDPYLWVHLAGLAAFPLFLEGCLIGFAVGDPFLPAWLELLFVATVGIIPVLWMQWQRPFYIFSLVAASVKPDGLTEGQRRLLTLFKLPRNRVLAVLVAVALLFVLQKTYAIAPIAAATISFLPASHGVGLLLAAAAFLACNLFVQVPVSVASVMLSSEPTFVATRPYPLEQVRQGFTIVGLRLNQVLPSVILETQPALATVSQSTATEAAIARVPSAQHADGTTTADSANPLANDLWAEIQQPDFDRSTETTMPTETTMSTETATTEAVEAPHAESEARSEADLS